jgi:hypothetical protein
LEILMAAQNRNSFRKVPTRFFAMMALLCAYGFSLIGASALLLSASATSALAHDGFHRGGFHGRGFGVGLGVGPYPYDGYGGYWPYYGDVGVCYAVSRRVKTRWGWGTRRVSICE